MHARQLTGRSSVQLGLGPFTDMTVDEFSEQHKGSLAERAEQRGLGEEVHLTEDLNKDLPPQVDWVDKGAVTGPRDQGKCNSGWAFASAAAIEGVNKIYSGGLVKLSPQMLVDCSMEAQGCTGAAAAPS